MVSTLSDELLGDGSAKVLASGGEDGTIRLWSLSSSVRGQQALKATLYGHQKPVTFMSVAGYESFFFKKTLLFFFFHCSNLKQTL